MSISTKGGDKGDTSLWSGERVRKDDLRVEAYGSLDELSSFLGLARHSCLLAESIEAIEVLQRELSRACSELASIGGKRGASIGAEDEERLTAAVHSLEERIPLKGFVLAGMTPASAAFDVARTVCRRAERRIVALSDREEVGLDLRRYINRLSDYLFMLARNEEAAQGKLRYK